MSKFNFQVLYEINIEIFAAGLRNTLFTVKALGVYTLWIMLYLKLDINKEYSQNINVFVLKIFGMFFYIYVFRGSEPSKKKSL